jgi:integrase
MESGSDKWSHSTYKKVRTIYSHLREFEESRGEAITFSSLDERFPEQFREFYEQKGNSMATTAKAVNIIVWFMNWATRQGFNIHSDYRSFYRKLGHQPGRTRIHLFLRWDELMKLFVTPCPVKRMERVRDLFCFMCFTGLRYSELQNLRRGDVMEHEVVVRKALDKVRRIPMNSRAKEVFRNYEQKYYLNDTAFPIMSGITFNKYLRRLGEEAGLDRRVYPPDKQGDGVPLHERLTAGIAVHTFIANALELCVPAEVISHFTGVQRDARVQRIRSEMAKNQLELR